VAHRTWTLVDENEIAVEPPTKLKVSVCAGWLMDVGGGVVDVGDDVVDVGVGVGGGIDVVVGGGVVVGCGGCVWAGCEVGAAVG